MSRSRLDGGRGTGEEDPAPMIPQDIANTIVDPRAYADGTRIDDAFRWLRANAPLAKAQPEGFDPFWVVTRFADIQEIEKQNDLFHNGDL
eukprot:gene68643-94064_t